MELTEDGIVKTINVPYSNSRVGKKAAPAPTVLQKKANPREFLTEEILMASSTAKMAELVAKEIYNIRESKNALLRGQADNMPSDGAQLKIIGNSIVFTTDNWATTQTLIGYHSLSDGSTSGGESGAGSRIYGLNPALFSGDSSDTIRELKAELATMRAELNTLL